MVPRVNITFSVRVPDMSEVSPSPPTSPEVMQWVGSDPWTSPGQLALAVILVLVLSVTIICSNALILIAVYRFKRLRNPSNYFVASLASADFCLGLLLPPGLYFEMVRPQLRCLLLCLLPYCLFILLCSVALLSATAVAVDRCTSLASPLRYNNIITHGSVVRYITLFWIYSLLLAAFPLLYWFAATGGATHRHCAFTAVVLWPARAFLFAVLFLPCTLLLVGSYGYVYVVARSHARAIFSSELSFRQHPLSGPRYGRTLAGTVGLFCLLWLPLQAAAAFVEHLPDKAVFYLGLLAVSSAAADPWMYGYRSAEFRIASLKILEAVFPQLRGALRKPQVRHASVLSCASHVRLGVTPNNATVDTMCATFIEIPMLTRSLEETAVAAV